MVKDQPKSVRSNIDITDSDVQSTVNQPTEGKDQPKSDPIDQPKSDPKYQPKTESKNQAMSEPKDQPKSGPKDGSNKQQQQIQDLRASDFEQKQQQQGSSTQIQDSVNYFDSRLKNIVNSNLNEDDKLEIVQSILDQHKRKQRKQKQPKRRKSPVTISRNI